MDKDSHRPPSHSLHYDMGAIPSSLFPHEGRVFSADPLTRFFSPSPNGGLLVYFSSYNLNVKHTQRKNF